MAIAHHPPYIKLLEVTDADVFCLRITSRNYVNQKISTALVVDKFLNRACFPEPRKFPVAELDRYARMLDRCIQRGTQPRGGGEPEQALAGLHQMRIRQVEASPRLPQLS
ncbi:hypothetical protein [Burkholderia sp. GS2Y]|uniref:Uncharacterized protein n=1 Tax=Burkholderia theae TaxID=3143496 RepID=A0ABU9WJA9_9BURK